MKRWVAALCAAVGLAGCGAPAVRDYAEQKPKLDLRTYFDGTIDAWGTVQDRSGRVTRRMTVEIVASWQGDVGTLDERFTHDDGKTERRVWTIRKEGDRYTGTAHDVIGEAKGEAAGNALHWTYVLAVKRDNGDTVNVDMDDWMWLLDERTLMNRTRITKFGVGFGEVSFFFRKRA
jgi:hypothetical protein